MEKQSDSSEPNLSLYHRLGGWVILSISADKFCDRLSADEKLAPLLENVDTDSLKKHTADFASSLLGGPRRYFGPRLETFGDRLRLDQSLFDRGISHMIAALVWTGVSRELIEEVVDKVTPLADQLVVRRDSAADEQT